ARAGTSWYRTLGPFSHSAPSELHSRVPRGNEVIPVGTPIESRVEGDEAVSTWTTDLPIRVAGFNFGKFKKTVQKDEKSGFEVDVYSAASTPDVVYQINRVLSAQGGNADDSLLSG